MKFFSFLKYFLCITFSFLVLSSPVFAGANVAVKGEGDEVPSYVRANITGFDFHGEDLQGALEGWMPNGQHDPSAVELAQEALAGSINNALSFTYQLIEIIQDRVKYTKRHTGPAWPASRTLRERIGSCRDLAMLMVEACRSIGIPSRFVSGYHFEDPLPSELDLHAWAELYIPGAGWRGFDPTGKGLIDDRYLTLVSSSKSNLTSVITGNFIGKNNLENTLSWEIKPLEIK